MAMRRQPISLPPPVSFERGRPYPARRASDSDSSMFRPPAQRSTWVTAPRNHSASPPLMAILEHGHDGKRIHPENEYHRRLKAASKRDRHKLAKEDEYALDRSLAQVAPEHACARCKSQRWRCYIPRDPHSPRRTCLPCGKNKCTFGGSKSRPPTVAEVAANATSITLPLPVATSQRRASVSIASSASSSSSSSVSSTSDRLGLDMVDNKLPRPRLAPPRPTLLTSEFQSYRSLAPTPPHTSASLPTPQLSPAISADAFQHSHLPTSPRDGFFLPPTRDTRPLPPRHIQMPERGQSDRRMSVPALLSSPTPSSTSPTSSAPATPAATVIAPPAEDAPTPFDRDRRERERSHSHSYHPYQPKEYMPSHHSYSHGSYRGSTYGSADMPPPTEDLRHLLLDCAERSPRDPRPRRIAESMLGGVREQWVSSIIAAQHRGEARRHDAEAQFQMGRGLQQARDAFSRVMDRE